MPFGLQVFGPAAIDPSELSPTFWIDATFNTNSLGNIDTLTNRGSLGSTLNATGTKPQLVDVGGLEAGEWDTTTTTINSIFNLSTVVGGGSYGVYGRVYLESCTSTPALPGNRTQGEIMLTDSLSFWLAAFSTAGMYVYHNDAGTQAFVQATYPATPSWFSFAATYDGATMSLQIDEGTPDTTPSAPPSTLTGQFRLGFGSGGSKLFDGVLGELVVVNGSVPSDEQRQGLFAYFANKWSATPV